MPLGPLDWFPRVLFESQRALLLPRSPQRERIAVDTELWCTLHVRRKNLWAIQSLDVQVRRIPMSSLAQFASGMRQLNCGSSSRFTWHWCGSKPTGLRLNRWTSTQCWFTFDIRTSTWPTTNPISLRVSHVSLAPGGAFFSPLAEVRTRVSSKVWTRHPFGWRRWATCRVDGSERSFVSFCFFLMFWFLWNTSRQIIWIQLLQSQLYYFKADRIKTCQRIKTRAILIHQKQP